MLKRYLIKVLKRGDTVLAVQQNQLFIRRCNGEVDIVRLIVDPDGFPRLDATVQTTITFGEGTIEAVDIGEDETTYERGQRSRGSAGTKSRSNTVIARTF